MKSTKIAYISLIILIGLLVFTTYLKLTYIDEKKQTNETNITANSISLSTIANNYNNGTYQLETTASINSNNLDIEYNNQTYSFTFISGILKYTYQIDNKTVDDINNMFVNLVDAVSIAKNNQEGDSIITTNLIINGIYSNDAIKVIKDDNTITYIIDTTKDILLYKSNNIYKDKKILNLNETNCELDINNIRLISPVIKYNKNKNSYNIKSYVVSNNNNISIKLTLYDKDKKNIKEQSENITSNLLNIDILLDSIKEEDVIYYSIEIN